MRSHGHQNKTKTIIIMILIILVIAPTGCTLLGYMDTGPKLGSVTALQRLLNDLPPIQYSGRTTKFRFGGKGWIGSVDGKPIFGGSLTTEESAGRTVLKLTPTHAYLTQQNPLTEKELGWVKTPEVAAIYLEFNPGPPATLTPRLRN